MIGSYIRTNFETKYRETSYPFLNPTLTTDSDSHSIKWYLCWAFAIFQFSYYYTYHVNKLIGWMNTSSEREYSKYVPCSDICNK